MKADFTYDVVVIGAGHAGCEAAHAAARMGVRTCLLTMDMGKIAQMSCNPAVGGIAKGQIAREVDALGGLMGIVTDASAIQFKMLNRSKGPAMWSPRAQCDRMRYSAEMRRRLENTENLSLWQDEAASLKKLDDNSFALETVWGITFQARCVIITAGTFLNGLMHIGHRTVPGGRSADLMSKLLTFSLQTLGLKSARMKTGTPVRIDKRSVRFDELTADMGEEDAHRFSYIGEGRVLPPLPCWTCNTTPEVHEVLRRGLPDSPLY
ncbi:MAG: FAD-dependent oxidoreductase, partial [Alloprevotella sp.]|nr:FAD-dependent oxidoreductase [Alloprevotella sp.]